MPDLLRKLPIIRANRVWDWIPPTSPWLQHSPHGPWAELAAATTATVVALQWLKRQPLLSILAGTALRRTMGLPQA